MSWELILILIFAGMSAVGGLMLLLGIVDNKPKEDE